MAAGARAALVLAVALVGCQQVGIGGLSECPAPASPHEPSQTSEPISARQDLLVVDGGYSAHAWPARPETADEVGAPDFPFAVVLENPNRGWIADTFVFDVEFRDGSGRLLATGSGLVGLALPGARVAWEGLGYQLYRPSVGYVDPNVDLRDVRDMEVSFEPFDWIAVEPGSTGSFSFENVKTEELEHGYSTTGVVKSDFAANQLAHVVAVYRDSAGSIVGGSRDILLVPCKGEASFETHPRAFRDVASTEVYANIGVVPDF